MKKLRIKDLKIPESVKNEAKDIVAEYGLNTLPEYYEFILKCCFICYLSGYIDGMQK